MCKKIFLMGLFLLPFMLLAQNPDIPLGKINFPRPYIQAGKEFPAGKYDVVLTVKDAVPFFNVYDSKQELLFGEMAIVKARLGSRKNSTFRLKKEFLKGDEYFRIMVVKSDQWLMGYFLVKK